MLNLRQIGALSCLAIVLSGCVERKETIRVTPGRVDISVNYSTQQENDLRNHDAAPSLRGGWLVQEHTRTKREGDEDKTIYVLEATASFPIAGPMPANYAEPGEADADVFLQFPTQVKIERRRDGVYYHFSRRYEGRTWAAIEAHKRAMEEQLKDVAGKKPEQLTHDDRVRTVRALMQLEINKKLVLARWAFEDAAPNGPQDAWLAARAAALAVADEIDYDRLAKMIETADDDDEDRKQLIEGEANAFEAKIDSRLEETLRVSALPAGLVNQFQQRYQRHQRYHQVTEDLNDDAFEITVEMPGEIVGSNADSVLGTKATWKFSGADLHDRDIELLVTSRASK